MWRPELAASELAGVWKPHDHVCMRLCIGALRLNWHCLLSLFSTVCLFCITLILRVPISALQWPNLYKCFVSPREFLFCLSYLILPLVCRIHNLLYPHFSCSKPCTIVYDMPVRLYWFNWSSGLRLVFEAWATSWPNANQTMSRGCAALLTWHNV